jgi:ribonuclease D
MITNHPAPLLLPTRETINAMEPFAGLDLKSIRLVTTQREAASAVDELLRQDFLGFDTESRPTFKKGQVSEGPHVVQFSTQHRAYIFQTFQTECRPAIAKILESEDVAKIGFGLSDDIKRITGKLKISPRAIIDIDRTFKSLGQKNSIGTKTAIALLFNRRLIKSHKATTSNWANRRLSEKQLLYAANDAFAALAVYMALKKRGIEVIRGDGITVSPDQTLA